MISCCTCMRGSDIPADFPGCKQIFTDDEQINSGKSSIIAPGGTNIAGPLASEVGILYAEIDLSEVRSSRRSLDVGGHYNRPDIFSLEVNRQQQRAAILGDN
ncbi:aliphatic nitrilase [Synechococcus sp. BIOS-E4-1]|nr:aliphatic nitrilase [Synechococcus sp. BIOS-E4-1]